MTVRVQTHDFDTGFEEACMEGHNHVARFFIEKIGNNFNRGLEHASEKCDIELIKLLIEDGKKNFKKREVDFFGKSLILVILSGLVFIVVFFFSMALFRIFILDTQLLTICSIAFSGVLASIILSRFSMILPSVAIDKKMDFLDTLEFTKNYKFLSLFMVVIFPFIIAILIAVVYGIVIKFFSVLISSYFEILYVFLNVFITVLVISCLSVTYSYIEKENNQKKFL